MKRAWVVAGVCLAFVPMLLVGLLLLAIKWPRMDAVTRQMPDGVRTTVAATVMQNAGWGKEARPKIRRVLALDPDNATAWARTCSAELYPDAQKDALESCRRAVALNDTSNNYYNLGKAEEAGGEECDASDAYLKSSQKNSTGNGYVYMEGLGRAALRCGKDPYLALAGLRGALDLEAKDLEASDPKDDDDDTADERTDLATDRKYWAVLQMRLHDGKALAEACSAIDVTWKHCACGLNDKGEPECSGS